MAILGPGGNPEKYIFLFYISNFYFVIYFLQVLHKSVFAPSRMSIVYDNNNSDSDSVDTLAITEQPDEALSHDSTKKKKKRAKQVMSTKKEDAVTDWITETS